MVTVTLTGLVQLVQQLFKFSLAMCAVSLLCQREQLPCKEDPSFPISFASRLASLTRSLQSNWDLQPLLSHLYEEADLRRGADEMDPAPCDFLRKVVAFVSSKRAPEVFKELIGLPDFSTSEKM